MTTNELLQRARERMEMIGLSPDHDEFLFADWPEGDEHLRWLLTASQREIENWIDDERPARNIKLQVRVTEAERDLLQEEADEHDDGNLSAYLRRKLFAN